MDIGTYRMRLLEAVVSDIRGKLIKRIKEKMKLGRYEKKFVRMMAKVFSTMTALTIILSFMGVSSIIRLITSMVMVIISFLTHICYWNHLERLELQERYNKII